MDRWIVKSLKYIALWVLLCAFTADIQSGQSLTNNFTTTLNTATNTPLTFQIMAGEVYIADGVLSTKCSGPGGLKFAIAAPAGTQIEGWIYATTVNLTTLSRIRLATINTLTTATNNAIGSPVAPVHFWLRVKGGGTGQITLQVASSTPGETSTILAGSWWRVHQSRES